MNSTTIIVRILQMYEEKTIELTWISYILGCRYQKIQLNENKVILTSKSESLAIEIGQLESLPEIKSGKLSQSVKISHNMVVKGLSKKSAKDILNHIYKFWFSSKFDKINKIALRIDCLLKSRYVKTSEFKKIVQIVSNSCISFNRVRPDEIMIGNSIVGPFNYLMDIFDNKDVTLENSRKLFLETRKQEYKRFFDNIESNPLTEPQRNACIIDNDNNLVLAGAGTGKTSTMVGRAGYLVKSKQATPEQILLLAFGSKAQKELQERIEDKLGTNEIKASTFHALGLEIIGKVENKRPDVSNLATDKDSLNKFIDSALQDFLADEAYAQKAIKYFERYLYPAKNHFDFKTQGEYLEYLSANDIRTLKGEQVKSYEECLIANYLFTHGVEYAYEAPYKVSTETSDFRQYKPDFYLTEYDTYIEHYGIDRNNKAAPWIDNNKYLDDIQWKRDLHKNNNTRLIETFHYERIEGDILFKLEEKLSNINVTLELLPKESIFDTLREFGRISLFSQLLRDLLVNIKSTCTSQDQIIQKARKSEIAEQAMAALDLFFPILDRYEKRLSKENKIDFNDMVNKAINHVKSKRFIPKWKYILIDEFQDISAPRAELVLALRDALPGCSIFCVGDDWQAIYRFTGSDLVYTTEFYRIFGYTSVTTLDKTYRFNNSICDIASTFVSENKTQIEKDLETNDCVDHPAVSILKRTDSYNLQHVNEVLAKINTIAKKGATVFIISRYKFKVDPYELKNISSNYTDLNVTALSMHASKGKEADYVIVIGLEKGTYGFPSEKITHPLLECYLPKPEKHEHAEERRLFYVAVTRAKKRVYLVCDMTKVSCFISEIIENPKYKLCLDEFDSSTEQSEYLSLKCPSCKSGNLLERKNEKTQQKFYGCSNWSLCEHTESACPRCDSAMQRKGGFRVCFSCKWKIPLCQKCGADMKFREKTKHWGCSNYRGKDVDFSCRYQEKYIDLS